MGTDLGLPSTRATAADYTPDEEVRWCPGCGDYAILSTMRELLPTLGVRRESTVFVSGIGCSSRFPYYVDTYGLHSIHGRAPAIATGLAVSRPDLSVWVVTGDGDGLSIGGNHLIHALRRNVDLTILLFDNGIYGLTKGQYSPTSPTGTVTRSSPAGSVERPLNPLTLALGVGATFVACAVDVDRPGLSAVLAAAAAHRGAALVHILQDCPVFHAGVFDAVRSKATREEHRVPLRDGMPIRFGPRRQDGPGSCAVVRRAHGLDVVPASSVPDDEIVVHDATDLDLAFGLARIAERRPGTVVTGVLRAVALPTYGDGVRAQAAGAAAAGAGVLQELLRGTESWTC
ncbi:2-oxoacid:ferredoxin oxidoreductase subunit beta [Pseudonocardia sp.]|uniref:2-oxoacid:ferredoxin oxidoreductase subunit beta n=1 Tax=Pseudonocardia sp. TaxID=60912 RepID=UPI003D14CB39